MCKSIRKGQNVPGTDGTYHRTDGTCPRDRRDAHQGVSRQNSLCYWFFLPPGLESQGHLRRPDLRWPGDSQRQSGRFARIDSHESVRRKTPVFITSSYWSESPPTSDSQFLASRRGIRQKGVKFGNPETIRENQGDSRESANRLARIGPSKVQTRFV